MTNKVDIDTLACDLVDKAIMTAISETVDDIAADRSLHDTHDDPHVVGKYCREKLEKILDVELDKESSDWIEGLVYREMRDYGYYTSPTARKMLIEEYYTGARAAMDSDRWRSLVDLLKRFGYFDNISVNDVLEDRDFGKYSCALLKNHGMAIGWNTILMNDWARFGIDPVWNKVSDAAILLYWPGVDTMGKRHWNKLYSMIEAVLDPKSKDHKACVRHWDRCYRDYEFNMHPVYGADAC